MAENMCLKSIFDMDIIASFIIVSEWAKVVADQHDELVPFLMYQWFDKHKIFTNLIDESLPQLLIIFEHVLLGVCLIGMVQKCRHVEDDLIWIDFCYAELGSYFQYIQ